MSNSINVIPLICGIFLIETLSVIIQVSYFKYTKNSLGKGKTKQGLVYGKEYQFKISQYGQGFIPSESEKKKIIWEHSYINKDGEALNVITERSGETYKLKIDNLELCGKEIKISAYYEDNEAEGVLNEFCHNRFRYFDSSIIETQIRARASKPWKIDQASSSLCGVAGLFYLLAKKDASGYTKMAKELHQKGECNYNGYTIKPHEDALEMYDMNPNSADYKTVNMPLVDWIVLATTRSKESSMYNMVYRGIENGSMDQIRGVNWPRMMKRLSKELLGYTRVEEIGLNEFLLQQKKRPIGGWLYDEFSNSDLEHLQKLNKEYKWGKQILMMIDAKLISDEPSYSYADIFNDSHWVVYEGGLQLLDKNKKTTSNLDDVEYVSFKIYTWGYDPVSLKDENGVRPSSSYKLIRTSIISSKSFKSNFYGYIKMS